MNFLSMKKAITLLFLFSHFLLWGQKQKKETIRQQSLERAVFELKHIISPNWFLQIQADTILLTYCKSCNEAYENYSDSLQIDLHKRKDRDEFIGYSKSRSTYEIRQEIFTQLGPDSVSYYSTLCYSGFVESTEEAKRSFCPDDILQFKIIFEETWSPKKVARIQKRNDQLKDDFLDTPLLKLVVDFDDYRAYIPSNQHKDRIDKHHYYFQRLPYQSTQYNYSIFLSTSIQEIGLAMVFVDKNDPYFFAKKRNYIQKEYHQTLLLVAYALGLKRYQLTR